MNNRVEKIILKITSIFLILMLLILIIQISSNDVLEVGKQEEKIKAIEELEATKFKKISAGYYHGLAIDINDNLWAWGANNKGALGNGTTENNNVAIQVMEGTKFKEIAAGSGYSMAIDEEGKLWTWGSNTYGQLGNGQSSNVPSIADTYYSVTPIQIMSNKRFDKIEIYQNTSFAIDTDGNLWGWGDNTHGVLGNGQHGENGYVCHSDTPIRIGLNTKFKEIKPALIHCIALDTNGNLWAWGANSSGQFGNNTTTDSYVPAKVNISYNFSKLVAGGRYSTGIDANGNLFTWGGLHALYKSKVPTQIYSQIKFEKVNIEAFDDMLGIDINKNLLNLNSSTPSTIMAEKKFVDVDGKWNVFLALDEEGNIWSWGNNENGALGDGTNENATINNPTKVITAARTETTKYTVTLNNQNATTQGTTNVLVEAESAMPNITIPTKIYHTFGGYYTQVNGQGTQYYTNVGGSAKNWDKTEDTTLYAKWIPNNYTITIPGTDGKPVNKDYTYGEIIKLPTPNPNPGFKFEGWYDNEDLEGNQIEEIDTSKIDPENPPTLYPKWTPIEEEEYYITSPIYEIDKTNNIITKVSPNTTVTEFLNNINTNGTNKRIVNLQGQEVTENSLVGTGYKLKVDYKGTTYEYDIAVRGDLDGNGKITTTDLSIINKQILHKIELTGIKAKAADVNFNGKLTTTDLSMINQAVLRKITL